MKNLVFFKTLESNLIIINSSFINLCCRKRCVLYSYVSILLLCVEMPWEGSYTQLCSSERRLQIVSCKDRLAKTPLSRSLPELTKQRLNLQLNLLLVMLWVRSIAAWIPITTTGNWRDYVCVIGGGSAVSGLVVFFFQYLLDSCCNSASCHLFLRCQKQFWLFGVLQNRAEGAFLLRWCV